MNSAKPALIHIALIAMTYLVIFSSYAAYRYQPHTYLHADPYWMVLTVRSIVEDVDIDIKNQLDGNPDAAEDQVSLGARGEWYPVHEYLMPLMTVPLYVLFSINGCLLFNVLASAFSTTLIFLLCARNSSMRTAAIAAGLAAFSSLMLPYAYSYSLDVFGTAVSLLAVLLLFNRRYTLAGVVWGLSVVARVPNAVSIVAFILYIVFCGWQERKSLQHALRFLYGATPIILLFMAGNSYLYGSEFDVSYDHWLRFEDGQAVVKSQRALFSRPILEGLRQMLFSLDTGVIVGAPLSFLGVLFGGLCFWREERSEAVFVVLIFFSYLALYTLFSASINTGGGSRYMMFPIALLGLPLCYAIAGLLRRMKNLRGQEVLGEQP